MSLVSMTPEARDRILARLIETGGIILPDALYTAAEAARFVGCDKRTLRRMLEEPEHLLRAGFHDRGGQRGKLVKGAAILAYQASIRVAG